MRRSGHAFDRLIRGEITSREYVKAIKEAGRVRRERPDKWSLMPVRRWCGTCHGTGSIRGFFYGTIKKCPACDGRGYS